jgi:hypothetical protein
MAREGEKRRRRRLIPPTTTKDFSPARTVGAETLDPLRAAQYLGVNEATFFALWLGRVGPRFFYSGNEIQFHRADLDRYLNDKQRFRAALATVAHLNERPWWHPIYFEVNQLKAEFEKAKASSRRAARYEYLTALYCAVDEGMKAQKRPSDFEALRSMFNKLIERTSNLSKATRSRNSRALAFCHRDNIPADDLKAYIGEIKEFVARQEGDANCIKAVKLEGRKRIKRAQDYKLNRLAAAIANYDEDDDDFDDDDEYDEDY